MSAGAAFRADLRSQARHLGRERGLLVLVLAIDLTAGAWGTGRLVAFLREGSAAGPAALAERLGWVGLGVFLAAAGLGVVGVLREGFGDAARLLHTLPLPPAAKARALYGRAVLEVAPLWVLVLGVPALALAIVLGLRALLWIALCAAGAAAVLGPLAAPAGRLYERAFQASEARVLHAGRRRLLRLLVRGVARRRTPAAALVAKGLLSRGRSGLNWLRAAALAAALAFFPRLFPVFTEHGVAAPLAVVGAVSLLAFLAVFDGFASPLGAEGSRLALLLTAPLDAGRLLRAKALAFFVPFLPPVLGATLLLGFWSSLAPSDLGTAGLAAVLILAGQSALFAWGSAWDADLDREIEPGLRGLLQEEIPLTPPRLVLVAAGALLLGADLALLAALPRPWALPALAALNALAAAAAWRLGLAGLRRLARAG